MCCPDDAESAMTWMLKIGQDSSVEDERHYEGLTLHCFCSLARWGHDGLDRRQTRPQRGCAGPFLVFVGETVDVAWTCIRLTP